MDDVLTEIASERRRQIEKEGWAPEHDDGHRKGELALAAALYATPIPLFAVQVQKPPLSAAGHEGAVSWMDPWPFKRWRHVRHDLDVQVKDGDKRATTEPRRALIKAAALIVAEIERLDRAALKEQSHAS